MARNQVPFVPYQQVGLNQAPETKQSIDGISGAAFGAETGTAMQKFGGALQNVFDPWAREEIRLQQYKDTSNAIDFETKVGQQFEQARTNLTGAGEGFAKSFLASIDKQAEDLRKQTGGQVPRNFDITLQKIKAGYFDRALKVEMEKRDEFYVTDINKKMQPILAGAAANPDPKARDAFGAQARQLIDSSGLPDGVKEKMRLKLDEDLDMAYALGVKETNPEKVIVTYGGQGSLGAWIAGKESGNKPIGAHPGSSAWGRYGFTEGRWKDVANSPEGRAAGLDTSAEGRKSDAQQQAAFPIHIRMLARDLKDAGVEVNDKNLYLAHFLGGGGATQLIKAMRDDPNASAADMFPAAAKSNPKVFYYEDGSPRTVSAVYQLQTRGGTGKEPEMGGDPILTRLPFNSQQRVLGQAEQLMRSQASAAAAQAKAEYAGYINDFQMRLMSGQYGAGDIAAAVNSGRITDYDDVVKLENVLKRFNEKMTDSQIAAQRLAGGGTWNQYDAKDRKQINALGESIKQAAGDDLDKEMVAHLDVYQRSGIASQAMVALMRQGLNSTNPQVVGRAAELAWRMVSDRPTAFDAIDNGSELQKAADTYQAQLELTGSKEQAAAVLARRNDPETKNPFQKKQLDEIQKGMLEKPDALSAQIIKDLGFGRWFSANPKADVASTMTQMNTDYMTLVMDNYREWPDEKEAKTKAIIQMKRIWGEFDNSIMRWPPSKTYKPVGQENPYQWVKDSVTSDVGKVLNRLHPGATLGEVKLQTTSETIQDIAMGKPPKYAVWYSYKTPDGVTLHGNIPARQGWSDDGTAYKAAYEKYSARNAARAVGEITPDEIGVRRRKPGDPMNAPGVTEFRKAGETNQEAADRINAERRRKEQQTKEDLEFAQRRTQQRPGLMLSPNNRMVVPGGNNAGN